MSYLFVYGTLMNNVESKITRFLKANSVFVGEGYASGRLYDLGHYPGLVFDSSANTKVRGHIFQLENVEEVLAVLDEYEAVGERYEQYNQYIRRQIPIPYQQQILSCWVYLYNQSTKNLKLIKSGDYLNYLSQNKDYQNFIKTV